MLTGPSGYAAAARGSQRVTYSCDVIAWDRSSVLRQGIPVDSGTLTVKDDVVRRQGTVRLVDGTGALLPGAPGDLLHPYSHNLLRVRASVTADTGTWNLVLGTLRMRQVDPVRSREGATITCQVADDEEEARAGRSWPGQLTYLDRPQETIEARVGAVLAATHPPALVGWSPPVTNAVAPAGQVLIGPKQKTWTDLYDLCRANGWRLGVNAAGAYDLLPLAGGTFRVGGSDGQPATVVSAPWDMREFANTAQFLVNNGQLGTASAEAVDSRFPVTTPDAGGRWGIVWVYDESSDAAPAAAGTLAARLRDTSTGATRSVSFQAVPDYRVEGADVAAINLPTQGVVGSYGVESVTFTLKPGAPMQVKCREVRA